MTTTALPRPGTRRRTGLLATAAAMADATPADRNRVVDLLRAASILVVVTGHWLMAGMRVEDGQLVRDDVLEMAAWLHPLTWVLQVMPVFFLVGGYANALSWRSARSRGETYGGWLRARLRRLTLPVVPLMLFWAAFAPLASAVGLGDGFLRTTTAAALVPTWFLAAYVVVVALVPVTLAAWERLRWLSVGAALGAAALTDLVSIVGDLPAVGFLNYVFVWAGVHQLGYAWLDGALDSRARRGGLAALGAVVLVALVVWGPYAVSMVGVTEHGVNNAYPTRVTLFALGLLQAGVVLLAEPLLRALVAHRAAWTAVIVVNARIMTLYLWHFTAMGLVLAGSLLLGGVGLHRETLSPGWWTSRPLWLLVLTAVTLAVVAVMGTFEQPGADPRPAPAPLRPVLAVVGLCASLGVLADVGIVAAVAGGTVVNWWLPLLPVAVLLLGGVARAPRRGHPA